MLAELLGLAALEALDALGALFGVITLVAALLGSTTITGGLSCANDGLVMSGVLQANASSKAICLCFGRNTVSIMLFAFIFLFSTKLLGFADF
jgi:hypothetical protein